MNSLRKRLRSIFQRRRLDRELNEEIHAHLEIEARERIEAGESPEEAWTGARRDFGNITLVKEVTREMWGWSSLEKLGQDLRYALRMMKRNPGFALVATVALALGIGANTAIFSLVDAVLLKLLPVKSPEQLVVLDAFNRRGERNNFSHPMFEQLRDRSRVFTGVFAALDGTIRMDTVGPEPGSETEQAVVQLVSGEYFQVLGVNAIVGRTLTAEDNKTPGAHPVIVISYGFWKRRFAGDASIIGKSITLKDQPLTVIGVTPPGFFGETVGRAPDIWAPFMMQPRFDRGPSYLNDPNLGWLQVMARLQPGVSEERARAALAVLLGQLKSEPGDFGRRARDLRIEVAAGRKGLSDMRDRFSQQLRILMAVVGVVLLIACANVANLLLARATARQREVAIRLAIGAGRWRLIRQFLTESALMAAAGGGLGLLFAWWGSDVLLVLVSGDSARIPIDVTPNARILGFTLVVSLLTALLFGLVPAVSATRQNVNPLPKITAPLHSRLSLSRLLVVAQVALSLLLLTGAGLFLQTLHNLRSLDLGFAAEHILQIRIEPQRSGYKREQFPDLYRRLLERLNSAPGVLSASMSGSGFGTGTSRTCCIAVEGYTAGPGEDREIRTNSVAPGYFETMALPLLVGRDFVPQEAGYRPGESPRVAIINETMARRYFGNASPLGKRFGWGDPPKVNYQIEIIGVAKDAVYGNLREESKPLIYFPAQGGRLLIVRADGEPASMVTTIRREIQAVDKGLEISGIRTISESLDQALAREKLLARLSTFFGLLAVLLAAIGLYGVMAYAVVRRTQEIGIRVALGAQRPHLLWLVMRQSLALVAIGAGIGVPAALAVGRLISSQLFGISSADPGTLGGVCILLVTVAALAGYLPAHRAARVDPIVALHHE